MQRDYTGGPTWVRLPNRGRFRSTKGPQVSTVVVVDRAHTTSLSIAIKQTS